MTERLWERSTGATSAVGKAKAARNSLKHGLRSKAMRELFSRLGRERNRTKAFSVQQGIDAEISHAIRR
jgi:hypothetical protein